MEIFGRIVGAVLLAWSTLAVSRLLFHTARTAAWLLRAMRHPEPPPRKWAPTLERAGHGREHLMLGAAVVAAILGLVRPVSESRWFGPALLVVVVGVLALVAMLGVSGWIYDLWQKRAARATAVRKVIFQSETRFLESFSARHASSSRLSAEELARCLGAYDALLRERMTEDKSSVTLIDAASEVCCAYLEEARLMGMAMPAEGRSLIEVLARVEDWAGMLLGLPDCEWRSRFQAIARLLDEMPRDAAPPTH